MTAHPAKFSDNILAQIGLLTWPLSGVALDPFAGTGRIHELANDNLSTIGIEIEPEWADMHDDTIVGNALDLPFQDGAIDAIITSPCYGNRMADSHHAMDDSKRNTYTHVLGRQLHDDNSGKMQWNSVYREFHTKAWTEALRVLKHKGAFILNISDHIRGGERQYVSDWHKDCLAELGIDWINVVDVETPRQRFGANADLRVPCEHILVGLKR